MTSLSRITILSFALAIGFDLCHVGDGAFITNQSPKVMRGNSPSTFASDESHIFSIQDQRFIQRNRDLSRAALMNRKECDLFAAESFKQIQSTIVASLLSVAIIFSPFYLERAIADDLDLSTKTTTQSESTVVSQNNKNTNEAKNDADLNSVLDEVWTLVDKYYIDRNFNNQNWQTVLSDYQSKISSYTSSSPFGPDKDTYTMQLSNQMVSSLGDKYSRMLDKDAYANIQKFDLIGVGATFMPDASKRIIVGAPPVPGSAADLAGVKKGDFLDAVNGKKTEGRTAFDIIDQIGEDPNAKEVTMTVRRQGPDDIIGEGETRDVVLTRTFTEVKDPVYYKLSEKRKDGTKVGYIRISEFNALVKRQLEKALKDLESQGANAYVLDLRGNPGGAFQSAVEIASYFVDDTIATYVVDNNEIELPFRTAKGKVLIDKSDPLSIWVDRRSASASEVLAGALRDNCRGVVMGDTSFGKGLIQAVYGLKNGSGLVLTVARYVTPNGTDIQGTGIKPDLSGGVPGSLVPGLVTIMNGDTSKIDFGAVQAKSQEMCSIKK